MHNQVKEFLFSIIYHFYGFFKMNIYMGFNNFYFFYKLKKKKKNFLL